MHNTGGSGPLLGCVADDITGATDLAINLVQGGMRVVQLMELPVPADSDNSQPKQTLQNHIAADAIVIAQKTRALPAAEAIEMSLTALAWLQSVGCQRFMFKYCSTFDSTPAGNIGPVAEAMMKALDVPQTIFCPAFPRNGRSVYQGHLFVGGALLNESGMENHPINPMRDANLQRVLAAQATGSVGLVDYDHIAAGAGAVQERLRELVSSGHALVVTDCCDDRQLEVLAEATTELPFITGGSGIARYLPAAYRAQKLLAATEYFPEPPNVVGPAAILSGSCSLATQEQVQYMRDRCPTHALDIEAVVQTPDVAFESFIRWCENHDKSVSPRLIFSTTSPESVGALQAKFGSAETATCIEKFFGRAAVALVQQFGVRKLIVAGGETSGAVADALGVRALRIGPEICAGVPWTETDEPVHLALAFKSGNFGDKTFFEMALRRLPQLLS